MKKILAAIVCSMLLLSATACAASDKQTAVSAESDASGTAAKLRLHTC